MAKKYSKEDILPSEEDKANMEMSMKDEYDQFKLLRRTLKSETAKNSAKK